MADVEPKEETETLMEKIADKLHHHGGDDAGDDDGSSSSDSDSDKPSAPESIKSAVYRLFGRQKPVHSALGGGKRTHFAPFFRFSCDVVFCSL